MIFKKGFIQPVLVATMGMFSAVSLGAAGLTTEAHAPDQAVVEEITKAHEARELALGIVDGLTREERAAKIDAYFAQYNLPLAGHGMDFVRAADRYESIDWRLVAAIGMRESTGCKFAFAENNCWGWGRKVRFASKQVAINAITEHLAGENERTAHHYAGKDTRGILAKYNSVIPAYTSEIFSIMEDIEAMEIPGETQLVLNE